MKQSRKDLCRKIFHEHDGAHAKGEDKTKILQLFEEVGAAKNSAIVYFSQIKHEANNAVASTEPERSSDPEMTTSTDVTAAQADTNPEPSHEESTV